MVNLIKVEVRRLSKLWTVPLLILLAVYFSYTILDKLFSNSVEVNSILLSGETTFAHSFSASLTIFGPVILAAFFLGSDFTHRTLQQQVAQGHSRTSIVLTKVFVYSITSSLIMLITPLLTTGVVTVVNGWGATFDGSALLYLLRVLLLVSLLNISAVSIYVFFSFICKDVPRTLIVCAVFTIVFIELGGLLAEGHSQFATFYKYFPLNQLNIVAKAHLPFESLLKALLSSVITWGCFIGASIYVFNRQDLK